MALLCVIWEIVAAKTISFPSPLTTWHVAVALFLDPFYNNGPNDQGIGWNVLASL